MKFVYEGVTYRIVFIYQEVPCSKGSTTLTTCLISTLPAREELGEVPHPQVDLVGSVRHYLADKFNRAIARREAFKKAIAAQPRTFRAAAGHALKRVRTRLA